MKKKIIIVLAVLLLLLTGCYKEKREMEGKVKEAEAYYKDKYGEKVKVESSSMNEADTGYIGYQPNGDYTYVMEDGTTVTWMSNDKRFIDDKQYEEITEAIRKEVWEPLYASLSEDERIEKVTSSEPTFGIYHSGEVEAKGYGKYYEGDIVSYLKDENVHLICYDINAAVAEEPEQSDIDELTEQFKVFGQKICDTFDGYYVVNVYGTTPAFDTDRNFLLFSQEGVFAMAHILDEEVLVKMDHYIDVADGITMTSACNNLVFEEGDVQLVKVDNAELQQYIDDIYNALPYKSEKNKGSSYTERDQVHEERSVLQDGVAYKVVMSERVKNFDSGDRGEVVVKVDENVVSDGNILWESPGNGSVKTPRLYSVCSDNERQSTARLDEDMYMFVGKLENVKPETEEE